MKFNQHVQIYGMEAMSKSDQYIIKLVQLLFTVEKQVSYMHDLESTKSKHNYSLNIVKAIRR